MERADHCTRENIKKPKKWIKFRHRLVTSILKAILKPYLSLKCGVKVKPFLEQGDKQYLILMNHQTGFDQFLVGLAFKGPVYYVASEHIFSNGLLSRLLSYLVAPIPIKKQTVDAAAVRTCIKVKREGGTIAIAPEGNRTYSGRTGYFKDSIIHLARFFKIPIALFRIEGGYGVMPRWSDVIRKGSMTAYVSRVITPEEYAKLSDNEFYTLIKKELYVDEAVVGDLFYHKKAAEYLERAMYVCPFCGLSVFESNKDMIECTKCGRKIRYMPTKELAGVDFDFPYRFVADWYDYQCEYVSSLDLGLFGDKPIYSDEIAFSRVILYKKKERICDHARLSLYNDRVTILADGKVYDMPFLDIDVMTVLAKNKLNIYFKDKLYQISGKKRFNALKYMNIYFRKSNMRKGADDVKFLGL